MSELVLAQINFSRYLGQFLVWIPANAGFGVTMGECWRTPEMVQIYVQKGLGVKDSLHPLRLAVDLNAFINGIYTTDPGPYRILGQYWKGLSPYNRWGGDFHHKDGSPTGDYNHFEYYPPIVHPDHDATST